MRKWIAGLTAATGLLLAARLILAVAFAGPPVPTPKEHLGYAPGADFKLADYSDLIGYFQKLARASDRIKLVEFGRTSFGKPMYVAFLSDAENLKRLDRYREISRRLALGQANAAEASRLAAEGKAIVWIDSGLHATEVAPVQHAPELAYRMVAAEDAETAAIRKNVILMQIPSINPDGLDMVAHWYRQNVGTPYEVAPLPRLYQKYAGHDNNRDWFMLNLDETRAVTRLLFREWFPQIVYNQHQVAPFPARIFVPPYAEPLNPHIQAPVMEGINLIGAAIKERFAQENKPGVLSYHGFDAWWNGGLRSVPAFHNMHGILTETALHVYATPRNYSLSELPQSFTNGIPTREPSVFYQRPWLGGRWAIRDAVDYMLTADFAILNLASQRRTDFLMKAHLMARSAIEAGKTARPYAYLIAPSKQWDRPTAIELIERLSLGGIEVKRARKAFASGGKSYPEGSYVLLAGQPFRPYLVDLMEPQRYPELRSGTTGPTKRPYDIAGWTLSMQMGVEVDRLEAPFEAELAPAGEFKPEGIVDGQGSVVTLDHRENAAFNAIRFVLDRQEKVQIAADGTIVIDSAYAENPGRAANFAREFGMTVHLRERRPDKMLYELRTPRVALYEPWQPNIDQGWTQWLLDRYAIAHTLIHNADFHKDDLRQKFDTIVLAAQSANSILHGIRDGEYAADRPERGEDRVRNIIVQRPEYVGGIGVEGLAHLQKFVRDGGTLIALDTATELPIQFFPLSIRNLVRTTAPEGAGAAAANQFYSPGSLLRLTVDTTHPIAFGMPKEIVAFSSGGEAFDITVANGFNKGEREIRSVARFAEKNLLASGWVSGERVVLGKHALLEARYGKGRVVLFGFRPQFRGQPHGTFKLLLNAIYLGSAQSL